MCDIKMCETHVKYVRLGRSVSVIQSYCLPHSSNQLNIIDCLLTVVPVDGPLLLGRSGCSKVWYSGVNTDK